MILSTHIVADVEYIADEILILKEGRLADRGTVPALLTEIQDQVWECLVTEPEVDEMEEHFLVSNRRHVENDILLRIVSDKMPTENAVKVDPALDIKKPDRDRVPSCKPAYSSGCLPDRVSYLLPNGRYSQTRTAVIRR